MMEVFRALVVADIPVIRPVGTPNQDIGWIRILRVCRRWRLIAYSDGLLWAHSYTFYPAEVVAFCDRAGSAPRRYELSPVLPAIPSAALGGLYDKQRLERIFKRADLSRCSRIALWHRGDVRVHLSKLLDLSADQDLDVLEELVLRTNDRGIEDGGAHGYQL